MFIKALLLSLMALAAGSSFAAGPSEVAIGDRSSWPHQIASPEDFDLASRAELLAFGNALADTERLDDNALQARLKVRTFDHGSVARIRAKLWQRLTTNYILASADCKSSRPFCTNVHSQEDFKRAAAAFTAPPLTDYRAWLAQATTFHRMYVNELLRLAALFPRVSSEIDTFSARELVYADRKFSHM
jgi:hypothetical protein